MEPLSRLFSEYLWQEHEIDMSINDIHCLVWEAVMLDHEEIDTELFPERVLDTLPNPLLLHTSSYTDEDEEEWIFCVVTDVYFSMTWLHGLCLKNGVLVDENVPLDLL
ncbi:hypothetical protein [Alkalihalophilus marmarensis]|uniref:Uncharacterized protein n=1 Tax=Alkalihalophilus marmarensis DSM 21297 TaxID=1188261 RepID=U6SKF7_9BACI|nr:hypothetical protein [Alkalihalophilus marmarensis]ERN52083.1 hypothetical protein A33I_18495 [Alkalihalophilus marmarensis DSM 21297]